MPEWAVHEAKVREQIRTVRDALSCGSRESRELVPKGFDEAPGWVGLALSHDAQEAHELIV